MKHLLKRLLSLSLAVTLLVGNGVIVHTTADENAPLEETAMRDRVSISTTYPKAYSDWANGFMCGNGTMGAIVFGNPRNETTILNHRRFFIASTGDRSFNDVSEEMLAAIRDACVAGDFKTANDLANQAHGWRDGGEGNKHPGYAIDLDVKSTGTIRNYRRMCNYSTGEITVQWTDSNGDWTRTTFASRADNVLVQRLQKPTKGELSCTVQLSTNAGMNFPGGMTFTYDTDGEYLTVHALYPNPSKTGNAGYEGVTRVIVKGADATVAVSGNAVSISNAEEVLLLTATEKYYQNCQSEWGKGEVKKALAALSDDYDALLLAQKATHGELFDRVCLDLNATAEDRAKTNEELLAEQKGQNKLNPALYERLFDAGRFYYLCSAGEIGMPDLLGLWTGDCNVGWSGYYHLDANLNLQMSGAVIGNMTETLDGYWYLMDAWADGFRQNASDLLGCRGMLGGGNTPGETSGLISSLNYYYPYQYVTGEMAWLLYPYWEYYQATGDEEFLRNTLYPYLAEMGLFYEDFLQAKEADGTYIFAGSISPENQPAGLGLSLVNNSTFDISSCRWLLTTLLEVCDKFNLEQGEGEGVQRWSEILEHLPDYLINEDGALAEWAWEGLKESYSHRHSSGLIGVWPYREITPEADAELFAAASVTLSKKDQFSYENAGHGLLHAALIAANLKNADSVTQKLLRFGKEGFYFNGLASAHYVDQGVFCTDVCNTVPTILMEMLVSSDGKGVEFLPALPASLSKGALNGTLTRCRVTLDEMVWDTDAFTVKAKLTSDIDQTITLTQRQGIVSIDTDAAVSNWESGDIYCNIDLKAGESTEVTLHLTPQEKVEPLTEGLTATASSYENNDPTRVPALCVDGDPSTRWASAATDNVWLTLDLGRVCNVKEMKLVWEAAYAEAYTLSCSVDGNTWTELYKEENGKGGTEKRELGVVARYIKFTFQRRTAVNGVKYGYSLYEVELYGSEYVPTASPGDVDGDGTITSTDARLTLQYYAGKIGETDLNTAVADVDGDGAITSTDARLILQYYAGKIGTFPAQ